MAKKRLVNKDEIFEKWAVLIQEEYESRIKHLDYYMENFDDAYEAWLETMDETIERLLQKDSRGKPLFGGQDRKSMRAELELIREKIAEYFANGEMDLVGK